MPEPEREAVFNAGTSSETWPDFTWKQQGLAVFVDELYWHSGGAQVDGDHHRRNRLRLDHGFVVLVYTDHQVQNWPDRCAREVNGYLAPLLAVKALPSLEVLLTEYEEFRRRRRQDPTFKDFPSRWRLSDQAVEDFRRWQAARRSA